MSHPLVNCNQLYDILENIANLKLIAQNEL